MNPDLNKNTTESEKEPVGALISIILVVGIIFVGAYYFLKSVPFDKGGQTTNKASVPF